ncbi:hypothetical protein [Streptomyces cinereoruber]|uniref:hypothetical protein n=1 Tax=Streptomyces cinereoruber TaxID=67260 RepID=UPI003C2B98B0
MSFEQLSTKYATRLAALVHPTRAAWPGATERDLIVLVQDAAAILHATSRQQAAHLDTAADHLGNAHASRGPHRARALRQAERAIQQALKGIR